MYYINKHKDLKRMQYREDVSVHLKELLTNDYEELRKELSYANDKKKFVEAVQMLVIGDRNVVKELYHLDVDILNQTNPSYVLEMENGVVKAIVEYKDQHYLQVYFHKAKQPWLVNWCLKNNNYHEFLNKY